MNGGSSFELLGVTQLLSVPYSLHAKTIDKVNQFDITADPEMGIEEALFSVMNSNGDTVFAVSTFENDSHTQVKGGTGWSVQMAIDNKKPMSVFSLA